MSRPLGASKKTGQGLRRRRTSWLLVVVIAIWGAGCAGGDDSEPSAATAPDAAKRVKTGDLRQDPALVERGKPGATVVELWRYMKLGALPLALNLYDDGATQSAGVENLAGMLAEQEVNLAGFRPVVTAVEQTGLGPLLTVKAVGGDGRVLTYTYLMSRQGGAWRVRYDTFTHSALRTYVTNRVQNGIKPGAEPSGRALEAGAVAAERYRLSALR